MCVVRRIQVFMITQKDKAGLPSVEKTENVTLWNLAGL